MAAVSRLTRQLSEERASLLATEAIELAKSGKLEDAANRLKEAAVLAHDNVDVQAAFIALHDGQSTSPLIDLCRRYAQYHNDRAGDDAVAYLRSPEARNLSSGAALECLKLVLEEPPTKLSIAQDAIVSELSRAHLQIRQYLAKQLIESTTEFFENMFARGDESANILRSVVLEVKLWPNEDVRFRIEADLFVLFIAKLMESGHDYDGRALKGITLLLLADTARLYQHIDEDAFDALLTSLDFRLPADVRGQATLVITKFMEVAELEAQKYLSNFVTTQVAKAKVEALIISFSAAAQLFPVASVIMAQLFLTQGFLQSLVPILEQKFTGQAVHDSFLMLVNAACVDGACRKAIQEHCATFLSHKVSNGSGRQPQMAATVLAKLRTANVRGAGGAEQTANDNVSDLVDLFQKSLVEDHDEKNISDSIEGLAYTSLRPEVKGQIANDPKLIKALLSALEQNPASPEITIGGLSIVSNLTHYQPNLSEEQKKMSHLKAYANASKPALEVSKAEGDAHVEKRCTALVKAGVTATLIKINKTPSSATQQLTDKILLSLTRNKSDRGTIAQQGAVRLLVSHCQIREQSMQQKSLPATSPSSSTSKSSPAKVSTDAAHALARILISLNPQHVFPSGTTPHITSAVPPLASLLKVPSSDGPALTDTGPRDLLPVFESLLALTNLASASQDVANAIIRSSFSDLEDLLLSSSHQLVRRATVELICNLVAFPNGIVLYADGSSRALERLRILVAMADVDDEKTRSAAGGALAMLTEYEEVRKSMVEDSDKLGRTVEVVLEMVGDKDLGLKHRGFAVLSNLLGSERGRGEAVKKICCGRDGVEKVKMALRDVGEQAVLEVGIEVLKTLMGKA
ncbi:SWI5-dependent HO expression protein 4 [Exophiala xenobiotica]|uniref:SWI5-dependent HO expression protein 4 n=1 Tax=Lithohypha guttulata TaxID=1690604 RepID=A0ABR0KPZ1_9EURO|nr:SWI5-dependent HO expression protein 4 [Lithohypha guttulata]KAK5328882.1 SWI5-dependent HO expression protein 4 [Exophiala xenobiotica]